MPTNPATTEYLDRLEGRIAYDLTGSDAGPLVVCVPGMGDLRSTFRPLADTLAAAGYRVATLDLRGHGDSDTTFSAYDDVAAATDVLSLVEHLGAQRVVLVGNSMGAGAVAWAAAERPDLAAGVVLLGPFVRDAGRGRLIELVFRAMLLRPWGPAAWAWWFRRSHVTPPAGLDDRAAAVRAALRRPGRWDAFIQTTRTSHAPVGARLGEVRAPVVVVMGERDPDFPDPAAEAQAIVDLLPEASVTMVPAVGHYPQQERPDLVEPVVVDFVAAAFARA